MGSGLKHWLSSSKELPLHINFGLYDPDEDVDEDIVRLTWEILLQHVARWRKVHYDRGPAELFKLFTDQQGSAKELLDLEYNLPGPLYHQRANGNILLSDCCPLACPRLRTMKAYMDGESDQMLQVLKLSTPSLVHLIISVLASDCACHKPL